jgi:hypothetical protein
MGTDPDFDPGRPLISDRAVYTLRSTALGLALLALLGFVAWRDIETFRGILMGIAALGAFPLLMGSIAWVARYAAR